MKDTELKDRLKQAIKNKGINASKLARELELKPSFIYDILSGKSNNPSTAKMAKISEALDIDLSYLLEIDNIKNNSPLTESNFVEISSILVASNGPEGKDNIVLEEKEGEPYYFRQSWITDRLNTKPENLRMVFVQGDSMEPTLCHSDMVLVDITKKDPSPPGIFVIFDGIGLVVKRLEFIPNSTPPTINVLSDNSQYRPYETPAQEINIIGRVVWFAREI